MAYDDDDDDGPGFLSTAVLLAVGAGGAWFLWNTLRGQAQAATVPTSDPSIPLTDAPSGFVNLVEQVLSPGSSSNLPRGVRNNNPGNIKWSSANDWQGQTGQDADGFAIFSDPVYGLRAAFMILQAYSGQGATLPGSLAPFNINNIGPRWTSGDSTMNQANWIAAVEAVSGIPRAQQIDPTSDTQMQALVDGIVAAENGQAYIGYYAAQLPQAWSMATA